MRSSKIKPRVAIIGLGNIGIRHLQGLSSIASTIELEGVDPDARSCDSAEAEWRRLSGRGIFRSDLSAVGSADIVIIATAAKARLDLVRRSLELSPRTLVLEKVVFQKEEYFATALLEAGSNKVEAYVNCPRRIWPLYEYIKSLTNLEGLVSIRVAGRNIGLACNSVHYIDLLQYLSEEADVSSVSDDLGEIVESKRPGYYECLGKIEFKAPTGCRLLVSVTPEDASDTTIEIETRHRKLSIVESSGVVSDMESGNVIKTIGRPPYQSELSGAVVSKLLEGQDCGLATLKDSALAHAPFLRMLGRHFQRAGIDLTEGIPIT